MTDRNVQIVSSNAGSALRMVVRMVKKDLRGKQKAVLRATRKAARRGAKVVKQNVPVAFDELSDSIHDGAAINGAYIIADAPHAAAVENGSRPHTPPIEPLLRWVKLRGMQGLGSLGKGLAARVRSGNVTASAVNTAAHAARVADQLTKISHRGPRAYSDIDAPMQIARAIQHAISARGTKPNAFMARSLPAIEAILQEEIDAAMSDKGGTEVGGSGSFDTAFVSSAA